MKKRKIIVIDDDVDFAALMKDVLEATRRYEVLVAHDGAAGLELCRKQKPDLVYLDFIMPKMKGDEVIIFLKRDSATRDIPIIMISGLSDLPAAEKISPPGPGTPAAKTSAVSGSSKMSKDALAQSIAEQLGVDAFLSKPFDKEKLLRFTEAFLAGGGTSGRNVRKP